MKKTKVYPKAKNKTGTKHKVKKNTNRMIPDTSTKMKETLIENPCKRSHQNLRVIKYKKERRRKTHIWEKKQSIQKFPPNRVVRK